MGRGADHRRQEACCRREETAVNTCACLSTVHSLFSIDLPFRSYFRWKQSSPQMTWYMVCRVHLTLVPHLDRMSCMGCLGATIAQLQPLGRPCACECAASSRATVVSSRLSSQTARLTANTRTHARTTHGYVRAWEEEREGMVQSGWSCRQIVDCGACTRSSASRTVRRANLAAAHDVSAHARACFSSTLPALPPLFIF